MLTGIPRSDLAGPLVFWVLCTLGVPAVWTSNAGAAECRSTDPTSLAACYKGYSDAELTRLLEGTADQPFDYPEVCGLTVDSPALARSVLGSGDCRAFRREAFTLLLTIRRSIFFGDGFLGEDGASCFGVEPFNIVLRCGPLFVPDPSTPDPDDALHVTETTPIAELVVRGSELCALANCPLQEDDLCGATVKSLERVIHEINHSRTDDDGDLCERLCPDDSTPPALTCPPGVVTIECEGPMGTPIRYDVSALDNCDPGPSLTCFPPPGTILPAGTQRTVFCQAIDLRGNVSECVFEVAIVDSKPPAISCPAGPIVVDCVTGPPDGAVVNYPTATASDVCDSNPEVSCEPPSGSFFPLGTNTVVCSAMDAAANQATCSFEVEVVEQTPTELFCPGDITAECTRPGGIVVDYPPPMLSASCSPPAAPACEPPSGSVFPLGVTTVTCSTTDLDGTPIACEFAVTIVDTQAPTIICPGGISAECSTPNGSPVLFEPVVTDACDPQPQVTCTPPSGTVFPTGITVVACRAVDASGNDSSCNFAVTVSDTTAPEISCPQGPITVSCSLPGTSGGAVVNYPAPAVVDSCDPAVTLVCDKSSGSVFPLGVTAVTCTATDSAGHQSSCSFDVQVVDDAAPSLVCVNDLVRECTSPEGGFVDYPGPVVADECSETPTVVCTPASGSLFPIGATTVNCTATDPNGNVSTCSFTITMEDSTPPAMLCPSDMAVECRGPDGTYVEFNVLASDVCDPEPVVVCNPPSGTLFPPGLTPVLCSATDRFGNSSTCSFAVSVVDTTPAVLACPDTVRAECEAGSGTVVLYAVGVNDTCDPTAEVLCEPPSGSLFLPGVTVVTCTSTDSSGNQSGCQFEVSVVDTTPPALACIQGAIRVECDQATGGRVQYSLPAAIDLCDAAPIVSCEPPSGSVLPLGTNSIACTATDESGNISSCRFSVDVVDTVSPSLVCGEDIVRECAAPEGVRVAYPLPMATDTCDATPNLSCLPPSESVFAIGTTEVVCAADDQSGNLIQCTFNVTVVDTTPPQLECPADITATCISAGGAPVGYTTVAIDRCDPTPIVTFDPPSGHIFPLGAHTVLCTAVDAAGNVSSCSFTVTVVDSAAPDISCPGSFELECAQEGFALVEYPGPIAVDTCDIGPVVTCEPPSGSLLPPGAHVIRCVASDGSGNDSSCEFTVTVVDTTAPELVCPPNTTVECVGPEGVPVEYSLPVANDACDAQPPVDCQPPSGSLFAIGSTEVFCTSTDRNGNTTSCAFVVQVVDRTAPSIACPEPIVAECSSEEGAPVAFEVAATDTCDPEPLVTCEPPNGSVFSLGQTAVVCDAVDVAGNRAQCLFAVTVVDRTPPSFDCPADMTIACPLANTASGWLPGEEPPGVLCSATVEYPLPDSTDGCQAVPPQVICSPPSGTRLGVGIHEVVCRSRDLAGNESTCSFTIEVTLDARPFLRGDTNADKRRNIADAITVVRFLFLGAGRPECLDAADANDDGRNDLTDAVFILSYLFRGGGEPPSPFESCGFDQSGGEPGCERYRPCE